MFSGFFEKLKNGLSKTKNSFTDKISEVLKLHLVIDDELYDEIEEILITADIGMNTTIEIIDNLKAKIKKEGIKDTSMVQPCLKQVIEEMLLVPKDSIISDSQKNIILIVGVNGVGKTTSIGKLSHKYKEEGKKVLMAAADTFRAGAIEQLDVWSKRSGVDIVKQQEGADPAAVVFDALQAAKSRNTEILFCDTAGRLHNKKNLMDELAKINRVIDRESVGANKKTLLVLDSTTGQNAVMQAKQFSEICPLDGIILTKLDGTSKGGVIISIQKELNIPVRFIGVGEGIDDLQEFDAKLYVDALFGVK
ncbi:signal recognition particle-docking protein FtsY [Clostridium oryzae]|uniref:Signal recognition particle receptor FtsY n=1 Tax=Clostridium oryzae TaxID=1450648 RepID=A0A1V4IPF0_9CLOT|nr:signal recognition particle-docking protein FtsY [Clostridium oryzae]OPJ61783.1 signal recognition particle receptor FtsY [Clostridium oryzae]